MGGLLDRYPRGPAYDEMFGTDGQPRPHMRALYDALQTLTGDDLARRAEARDRSFRDQGVVFSHAGEECSHPEPSTRNGVRRRLLSLAGR